MKSRRRVRWVVRAASALALLATTVAAAQDRPEAPPWSEEAPRPGQPRIGPAPRVPLRWDRWYHIPELEQAMRDLAAAFPDLVSVSVIGIEKPIAPPIVSDVYCDTDSDVGSSDRT